MKLAAGIVVVGLFATALPSGAADKENGWYIYWGDHVIFGGPYPSEELCKTAMRDNRRVPSDAICEVIVYGDGVPMSGTSNDLKLPPAKP